MLFVAVLKTRGAPADESTRRRLDWKYPENVKVLGEYWTTNDDMTVVTVIETDDADAVSSIARDWRDMFEVQVAPAMTSEHGIELVKQKLR